MAEAVPRLSQTPGAVRHAGHRLGEDSRTVLRDWLGLDSAALDTLQASRVILDSSTPPDMPQAAGPSR
jgi:crotonobetainyl-CoA:carnitine CoA-transferase CaiB-like acyl-CoA transferase